MRKYIATRLHQALEMAPDDSALQAMSLAPHYVIDERLTEMFQRADVMRSVSAVIEAGIAKLPYPELLVEFDAEDGVRRLALLTEHPDGLAFRCTLAALSGPALTVTAVPIEIDITTDPAGFSVRPGKSSTLDRLAAIFAIAVALLMLNTQGIEKEIIEPRALNRQRAASGRPVVPRHTVLRVGTVVDAEGRSVGGGRHMPVHLRAGHVRHQAHGPRMTERKLVYIPPVLVNFHPGAQIPQPKKVLTR